MIYFVIFVCLLCLSVLFNILIIALTWNLPIPNPVLKEGLKLIDTHQFACPNCGSHFKKSWWLYCIYPFTHRAYAVLSFKKTNFKCPHCGKYDTCVMVESQGEQV